MAISRTWSSGKQTCLSLKRLSFQKLIRWVIKFPKLKCFFRTKNWKKLKCHLLFEFRSSKFEFQRLQPNPMSTTCGIALPTTMPTTMPNTMPKNADPVKDQVKVFSKLKLLQSVGFLDSTLNQQTLQFKRSARRSFECLFKVLIKTSFVGKFYLSSLFERQDPIQLYIGR